MSSLAWDRLFKRARWHVNQTQFANEIFSRFAMKQITSYSTYRGREYTKKNSKEGPVQHASSLRRLRKPGQTSTRITAMDGRRNVMEHVRPYSMVGYSDHRCVETRTHIYIYIKKALRSTVGIRRPLLMLTMRK